MENKNKPLSGGEDAFKPNTGSFEDTIKLWADKIAGITSTWGDIMGSLNGNILNPNANYKDTSSKGGVPDTTMKIPSTNEQMASELKKNAKENDSFLNWFTRDTTILGHKIKNWVLILTPIVIYFIFKPRAIKTLF